MVANNQQFSTLNSNLQNARKKNFFTFSINYRRQKNLTRLGMTEVWLLLLVLKLRPVVAVRQVEPDAHLLDVLFKIFAGSRIRIGRIGWGFPQSLIIRVAVQGHLIDANRLGGVARLIQNRTTQVTLQPQAVEVRQSAQFVAFRLAHRVEFELALVRVLEKSRHFLVGGGDDRVPGLVVHVTTTCSDFSTAQAGV